MFGRAIAQPSIEAMVSVPPWMAMYTRLAEQLLGLPLKRDVHEPHRAGVVRVSPSN